MSQHSEMFEKLQPAVADDRRLARRMNSPMLTTFLIQKPGDVTIAGRKVRVLAALADIEKNRRTRLSKAVTETCRSVLTFGGAAELSLSIVEEAERSAVEVTVTWKAADSDLSQSPGSEPADAPDLAVRRVGELLDGFSLEGWPGAGAVASLRMFAPNRIEMTDTDIADWSAMLGESQIEEVVRSSERRRKLLVGELEATRLQGGLLSEAGDQAGNDSLVDMLSLVASQTDNGVVILDANSSVVWVNSAFAAQWGFDLGMCEGQAIDSLLQHVDSDQTTMDRVRAVLDTGRSDYVELLARQADGEGRWTGLSLTPSLDSAGNVQRWIVLLRDVTQQKVASDALSAALNSAEQANRSKSEFLANMSHEIRTPMNAVIGMTELALGTNLTPEQHEYLSTVRMSAEALLELLNDILDLSKIEAGKVELDEVNFDLAEVVRDSLKALAIKAHGKGLELATRMPLDLPHYLHGDPLRLRQVLINLVGNAIKFTERGEVVVEFERTFPEETDESIDLTFTVRDTGIGIPADRLGQVFESFIQVDTSTTRQFGGTGLGLTITAELLRLMGGHVRVESEVGVGSAFHVTVPFRLADQAVVPFSERVEFSREHLEGRTVLVVDDNATNRRILEELLTNWGMRPRMAENADAAIKELEAAAYFDRPFDLLLVDAVMPGKDGFLMVKDIRDRKDFRFGTVMMLSSADRGDSTRRCRELEIGTYLVKPVSQSSLLESILDALSVESPFGGDAQNDSVEPARSKPLNTTATIVSADSETAAVPLRILIADDHEANRRLAEKILEKRGHESSQALNGREVLDRLQTESFDLILMDLQMPELDGFQTTAMLREREASTGTHTPVVALTAHAMKGDREECLEAGMDAYLSKPLRARELVSLVEKLCESATSARIGTVTDPSSKSATNSTSTVASSEGEATVPTARSNNQAATIEVDFSGALDRMDDDVDLLVEQMRFFIDDAPGLVDQITDSIADENGPQLQSAAHRLKGLVGMYDFTEAADLCLKLEFAGRDSAFGGLDDSASLVRSQVETLLAAIQKFVSDH